MPSRRVYCVSRRAIVRYGIAIFVVLTIWLLTPPTSAQKNRKVDLALVLAVDCSHSVDSTEFNLQMQGLAQAFASREIIAAIGQKSIAIMVIQWSGRDNQKVAVPWMIVNNAVTAQRAAGTISATPRLSLGKTSISAAIDFAIYQLAHSPVTARRNVIDISADGVNNDGEHTEPARERAIAAGITINGLAILPDVYNLDSYFKQFIAGGPGNFVMVANDYKAYGSAIKRKLLKEIKGPLVS